MNDPSKPDHGQNDTGSHGDEPDITAAMFLICSLSMSAIITYLGVVKLLEIFWAWMY